GWVAGGLVCGAMLLALHPLQRFAERVASVAVPNAKAPEQLSRQERLDLFEHQLRIAWEDGSLNPKERRLLEVTRTRLGISAEDANRLELALPNLLSPSTRRGKQRPMGAPR
ncbi:MAG TPA: hypothetical protein VI818_02035, partial [Candidatus Thermoplasmatota archaeon]|nr:hypothetical protein [Candidatus Thermoplasmatota archaeon]